MQERENWRCVPADGHFLLPFDAGALAAKALRYII
jgi:hypothetical protein